MDYIGRYKTYITWADRNGKIIIHNHKNPCQNAPTEKVEVSKLKHIPPRTEAKRLCKLCEWEDEEEAKKQFLETPYKINQAKYLEEI